MSYSDISPFLRRVLVADGTISGACGVLLILSAEFLGDALGLPIALLRYAGVSLIPFAIVVIYLSRRQNLGRTSVWSVVALNGAWIAASVLLLVSGAVQPTAIGYLVIISQAVAVAVFVELQVVGLRRPVAHAT